MFISAIACLSVAAQANQSEISRALEAIDWAAKGSYELVIGTNDFGFEPGIPTLVSAKVAPGKSLKVDEKFLSDSPVGISAAGDDRVNGVSVAIKDQKGTIIGSGGKLDRFASGFTFRPHAMQEYVIEVSVPKTAKSSVWVAYLIHRRGQGIKAEFTAFTKACLNLQRAAKSASLRADARLTAGIAEPKLAFHTTTIPIVKGTKIGYATDGVAKSVRLDLLQTGYKDLTVPLTSTAGIYTAKSNLDNVVSLTNLGGKSSVFAIGLFR